MNKATELDVLALQLKLAKATYGYHVIPDAAWILLWQTAIELLKIQGFDVSELEANNENPDH